jgi:undecaprenyl-diphosphatase
VFLLIVVATIPAVVVGFALEHALRRLFGSPVIVAGFLVANGVMLLVSERLRRRGSSERALSSVTAMDALVIGVWQCLALLPGLSRSGATMVGGLLRGIDHEASAHFSFLIATPIIIGATVLEVPKLLHEDIPPGTLQLSLIAAVIAGITALASTAFLMRYFRVNDKMALNPFGYYCILFGAACIGLLVYA